MSLSPEMFYETVGVFFIFKKRILKDEFTYFNRDREKESDGWRERRRETERCGGSLGLWPVDHLSKWVR